jgi:hypothetical protein
MGGLAVYDHVDSVIGDGLNTNDMSPGLRRPTGQSYLFRCGITGFADLGRGWILLEAIESDRPIGGDQRAHAPPPPPRHRVRSSERQLSLHVGLIP